MGFYDKLLDMFGLSRNKVQGRGAITGNSLDDLIYELRRAGIIGNQFKPVESVEDAVESEPIAARAVRFIVDKVKGLPILIKRNDKIVEKSQLHRLFEYPIESNKRFSFINLMEWSTNDYFVDGAVALEKDIGEFSQRVRSYWPLDAKAVRPYTAAELGLPGFGGRIVHFEYNGRLIPADQLLWLPYFTPRHKMAGRSPLTPALSNAGGNVAMTETYRRFMESKGTPGGVLKPLAGYQSPDEQTKQRYIKSFNDRHKGPGKAGNLIIPPEGMDFEEFNANLGETQYGDVYRMNREALAILAGTPMTVLNAGQDSTFANQEWAQNAVSAMTLIPYLTDFEMKLSLEIAQTWDKGFSVEFDKSELESTLEKMKIKSEIDRGSVSMSIDEKRREIYGLPPLKNGAGRSVFLTGVSLPIGEAPDVLTGKELEKKPENRSDLRKVLDVISRDREPIKLAREPGKTVDTNPARIAANGMTAEQRDAYWQIRKNDLDSYTRSMTEIIRKLYRQQKKVILEYLDTLNDDIKDIKHVKLWLDWKKERAKFIDRTHRGLLGIVKDSGIKIAEELGGQFEITPTHSERVTEFATLFSDYVNTTTYLNLSEIAKQILDGNRSIKDILKRVTDDEYDIDEPDEEKETNKEALIVAVTAFYLYTEQVRAPLAGHKESQNAQGYGIESGGLAAGGDGKEWMSAFLSTSRNEHMAADGQTVGIEDVFNLGGYDCQWPGDGSLPIEHSGNCYCQIRIVKLEVS